MKCKYPINRPGIVTRDCEHDREILGKDGLWRIDFERDEIHLKRGDPIIVLGYDNYENDDLDEEGKMRHNVMIVISPDGICWIHKKSFEYTDEM